MEVVATVEDVVVLGSAAEVQAATAMAAATERIRERDSFMAGWTVGGRPTYDESAGQ